MKRLWLLLCSGISYALSSGAQPLEKPIQMNSEKSPVSFYSLKMKSIDGQEIDFQKFRNKKVLIVNVASECGKTPQYADLQKLHEQYGNELEVLAFPSNDFGAQEPGNNAEIKQFCKANYGVEFQVFEKISVTGQNMAPLYKWLTDKTQNGWNDTQPEWNFSKYLISREGELIAFFPSKINPLDPQIVSKIAEK